MGHCTKYCYPFRAARHFLNTEAAWHGPKPSHLFTMYINIPDLNMLFYTHAIRSESFAFSMKIDKFIQSHCLCLGNGMHCTTAKTFAQFAGQHATPTNSIQMQSAGSGSYSMHSVTNTCQGISSTARHANARVAVHSSDSTGATTPQCAGTQSTYSAMCSSADNQPTIIRHKYIRFRKSTCASASFTYPATD